MESSRSSRPRHTCLRCGYKERKRVIERTWDWLYRCPRCDAYDWEPEPTKALEGTPVGQYEARP